MNVFSDLAAKDFSASLNMSKSFPIRMLGIILCGYIAGRANIITATQAKGLGNFVSRFALPALLFKNMVVLNFSNVNWSFLYSILVAKASVFFIVCVNDFIFCFPVEALYQTTYPEYLQYIYLVAPISLMMLNPIGFIFCEIQKWKENRNASQSKIKIVGLGLLRVLQNPIVFMVFIGIASNLVLGQKVPVYLENFLDGLASSFSGSALFYLGLTMVGQIKKLKKSTFVTLILLITAKLLVMPLLCREMVELLDKGHGVVNHTSLSNYAFLYGVFPAAPGVAIFATQFNMEVEIITSGMVISTFVSAPIMYVSAWLLTIPSMDPKPLAYAIQNISFDISIVSLVSLSIVCTGMMMWNFVKEKNFVGQILVFVLLYSSLYSTYLWTGLLSISLFLLKKREAVQIPVGFIIISGWGIPALLVGVLLIAGEHNGDSIDSAFFYGKHQMITTAVTLFCSILISGVSLMCMNRSGQEGNYEGLDHHSETAKVEENAAVAVEENQTPADEPEGFTNSAAQGSCCSCSVGSGGLCCSAAEPVASASMGEPVTPSFETGKLAMREEQHVVLCLLLVNLSSCLWWLFNQEPGRLYVELQFFCAVFNFGQGFISFGIFGLDKHLIILPFKRRLEFFWNNREAAEHRDSPIPEEIRMTCQQFVHYHRDLCVRSIVKERRCGAKTSAGTFCGCDLVNWLIEVGLASDRGEAVIYGDRLVQGGVVQHITNEFEFRDDYLFYRFLQKSPTPSPKAADCSMSSRRIEIDHSTLPCVAE
uniref:G protein-coupled receptor 155 n=1 Tax=Ornithorhynchus anatinus TaxID=9258 RepID=F6YFF0_ORNAN